MDSYHVISPRASPFLLSVTTFFFTLHSMDHFSATWLRHSLQSTTVWNGDFSYLIHRDPVLQGTIHSKSTGRIFGITKHPKKIFSEISTVLNIEIAGENLFCFVLFFFLLVLQIILITWLFVQIMTHTVEDHDLIKNKILQQFLVALHYPYSKRNQHKI